MKKIILIIFISFFSTASFSETYVCKHSLERYGGQGYEKKFYQRKDNIFVNQRDWEFVIMNETPNYLKLRHLSEYELPSVFLVIINKKTNEFSEAYFTIEDAKKQEYTKPSYGICEVY